MVAELQQIIPVMNIRGRAKLFIERRFLGSFPPLVVIGIEFGAPGLFRGGVVNDNRRLKRGLNRASQSPVTDQRGELRPGVHREVIADIEHPNPGVQNDIEAVLIQHWEVSVRQCVRNLCVKRLRVDISGIKNHHAGIEILFRVFQMQSGILSVNVVFPIGT